MREELRDLKAMRVAAGMSAETLASRFGIATDTFRDLEDGNLVPTRDLLEDWQYFVGDALINVKLRHRSAPRGLRRWLFRLS